MLKNDVIKRDEFRRDSLETVKQVKNLLAKLLNSKLVFKYDNSVANASLIDILRICKEYSAKNPGTLSNVILNTVYDAEKLVPGSGFIALLAFCEIFPNYLKFQYLNNKSADSMLFEDSYYGDLGGILQKSRRVDSKTAFSAIRKFIKDDEMIALLKESLSLSGASGNIETSKSDDETCVLKNVGFRFFVKPDPVFLSSVSYKTIILSDCKAAVIDGIIENYSEISSIIESAHKEMKPCIIFARGFNDEIVASLSANYNSRIVNIIPVTVNYDEVGANQLVDIAICCGTDVVSSLKGDQISELKWQNLPIIENIFLDRKCLSIQNKSSIERCTKQRLRLLEKLQEEQSKSANEDLNLMKTKIFNERINSMTAVSTNIKIGKNLKNLQGLKYDRICKAIELFNEISRWGLIDLSQYQSNSKFFEKIIKSFVDSQVEYLPPRALAVGIKVAISNSKNMISVGAWLKNEAA
jgi:hypothetical protein